VITVDGDVPLDLPFEILYGGESQRYVYPLVGDSSDVVRHGQETARWSDVVLQQQLVGIMVVIIYRCCQTVVEEAQFDGCTEVLCSRPVEVRITESFQLGTDDTGRKVLKHHLFKCITFDCLVGVVVLRTGDTVGCTQY